MKSVILNPSLPAYKKDFFETLNMELQRKGIELTVIYGSSFFSKSIKSDTDPKYSAIPMEAVEFKLFGFRIAWWRKIFQNIRLIKPDIIIINFNTGNISLWIVQLYCYMKKIKVGIWGCGFTRKELSGIKRKIRGVFVNFFLLRADLHICYGTKYKNDLLTLGIEESKIFVAQNTVNIEKILTLDIDKTVNNSPEMITFLFVGALIKEKKLELAIKAVAKLVREGYRIQFFIIGQGSIINELISIVDDEDMKEYIFVLGPKYGTELTSFFIRADIFILPGSGGLAVNEAMAYGLPVISTIGDGTVIDLLFENHNGYFLDEITSVENIYLTCKKALVNNKAQLLEMGLRSRLIVREKATLQNMVTRFESAVLYGLNSQNGR
jgi:glycosyltransferase involved in cell wall biosynthesis